MKKIFLFYLLAIGFIIGVFVYFINIKYINSIPKEYGDLPVVRIYTEKGMSIDTKSDYVNCSFEITNCEYNSYNFKVSMKDSYDSKEGGVGIRLRGSSTYGFSKKPYRIKFTEKQSLFGLRANKSWVLLADYLDPSKMRNYTAFTLGNNVFNNLDFTPTPRHVVLEINGEFKGVYLLCEHVDEEKGRTGVEVNDELLYDGYQTKEFPFLLEMDRQTTNYKTLNNSDLLSIDGYALTIIKYPDVDDRKIVSGKDVAYDYIEEYLKAVITTLQTNQKIKVSFREELVGFEDLVDLDSLIDFNLLNELMCNYDAINKSVYMHKEANKIDKKTGEVIEYSKLEFGPVWDFDNSLSFDYTGRPCDTTYYHRTNQFVMFTNSIFKQFLEKEEYYTLVKERWYEIRSEVIAVLGEIHNYRKYIERVTIYDCEMIYGIDKIDLFTMQYDYLEEFLKLRVEFFDMAFSAEYDEFITNYF